MRVGSNGWASMMNPFLSGSKGQRVMEKGRRKGENSYYHHLYVSFFLYSRVNVHSLQLSN